MGTNQQQNGAYFSSVLINVDRAELVNHLGKDLNVIVYVEFAFDALFF